IGAEVLEEAALLQGAAKNYANTLAAGRHPAPVVRAFREGTSMSRYLLARLVPLHKDAIEEQESRFPQLRIMPPEELQRLRSKFLHTDEPSFSEWMHKIPLLPNPPDTYNMFMTSAKEGAGA
ncbi:hypothetical protein CYMTET_26828, partial [Cymbomonas tetramitiformis]